MTVAAYAFMTPCTLSSDILRSGPVTECASGGASADTTKGGYLQVFESGMDCRKALTHAASTVQVVVSEEASDVAALNLVAALHFDEPQRDIYLVAENPSAAFSSRVRAAGGRGIIDHVQLTALVNVEFPAATQPLVATSLLSTTQPLAPVVAQPLETVTSLPLLPAVAQLQTPTTPLPLVSAVAQSFAPALVQPQAVAAAAQPLTPAAPQLFSPAIFEQTPLPATTKGCAAAFVSGRGGVGKSTLSLLTAFLLKQRGLKVVLIDLDVQFGDLSYLVEQTPDIFLQRMSLGMALNGPERPLPSEKRLCLIESPMRPEEAEECASEILELIKSLKTNADYVLINTGSFWSELQAILAQSADQLIFVMDQRATSIQGCKQVADLCVRLQIPSTRFCFLLNRCGRSAPLTSLDASMALGGAEVLTIHDGGSLVDEMLSLGCPQELLESDAAFAASFDALLATLRAEHQPASLLPQTTSALEAFSGFLKNRKRGGRRVAS
ncbi:MAG: AAA family ATPase [Coriobacteriia bacterium]|nr:AAA family ATPase [Coriobacteriia bacterium]